MQIRALAVYLDGNPVADAQIPAAATGVPGDNSPAVGIGLYARGPLRETIVSYDNVQITIDR